MEDKTVDRHGGVSGGRVVDRVILFTAAAVGLLYLYTAKEGQLPLFQQRGILFAFCLLFIFTKYPLLRVKGVRPRWSIALDVVLGLATLVAVGQLIRTELAAQLSGYAMPVGLDIVLGAALVVVTIEATRRIIGPALPAVAVVFILYAFFGHYLPGMFKHMFIEFDMIVYYLSLTTDGIFGVPLYVVAGIIVQFLIFAAMLRKMGLMEFFIDLASGLMGQYRGGPAKIAVIASAFMATMSGSAVANVVATGSFTIPLMKSIGYRPNFAGAVEVCASNGGVITPPVMGAAAFLIAETLGVSYWTVVVAAVIPAILYFWGVYVGVDLEAMKAGLQGLPKDKLPRVGRVLLERGYMLAPIFVLVYFLGYVRSSAMLAAFWGVVAIFLAGLIRKETRRRVYGLGLVEGLADGIKDALVVVTACACAGIVIGVLYVTGLGMRMSTILIVLSGGHLPILLLLSTIVCLILGMGIGVTPIYILVAMVVAPALIKLGVPPLAAHLFIFYMANLCHLTPPMCTPVFAACGISGGKIFPTAWRSMRLGAVLFVLPFFFAYDQSLIMQGSPFRIVIATVTALLGVAALATAFANHSWWGRIGNLPRTMLGFGGLALIYPMPIISAAGIVLVAIALLPYLRQQRRKRSLPAPAASAEPPKQEGPR
ncbi:MAG: TRAP transporter fused permease subunit [Chloroflexota bacterium]